jgi:hypothetical protein
MGVVIDSDAMTITEVVADGPASKAGLRVGDMIIGYDEQEWPGTPNVVALLANYKPGDTVNFLIRRGDEQFTAPVVLGAHPTRVIEPFPLWLPQEVDLTPYAGQDILVRFEYVSMPDQDNPGIALDNIAIPELNILDDAQGSDSPWDLEGWQHVDWLVPQRFLVQVASTGTQTRSPSVRHLIAPNDDAVSGEWSFSTEANEVLVFAISGLNDDTDEPGLFNLSLSPDN